MESVRVPSARPAEVCAALLVALEVSEGRRRSRKRDQTPDTIGLRVKRDLLKRAVEDDPNPDQFEAWLLQYVQSSGSPESSGAVSAMARAVFEEWRLVHHMRAFKAWLDGGALSEDADDTSHQPSRSKMS
jgi:hypothetical protein